MAQSPTASSARRKLLPLLLALGLAVALAVPAGWALSRPEPHAGTALEDLRAADDATTASTALAAPTAGTTGRTTGTGSAAAIARLDASLGASRRPAVPSPVSVAVPDLGIQADVAGVGVEPDGSMVIPASVSSVGWYRFGPAPGAAQGNAVLAGHVDTAEQGLGAFHRLREVSLGSVVNVVDEQGRSLDYEVVGKQTVTKQALPVDEIFARDGQHLLVLITCGGPFQPELKSYRDNVVVTAVPLGEA